MFAENRRLERREDILDTLEDQGFVINEIMDYTSAEDDNIFLEGTGSIVLDRANGKAYCALSPRADEELFIEFCEDFEFTCNFGSIPNRKWRKKTYLSHECNYVWEKLCSYLRRLYR